MFIPLICSVDGYPIIIICFHQMDGLASLGEAAAAVGAFGVGHVDHQESEEEDQDVDTQR